MELYTKKPAKVTVPIFHMDRETNLRVGYSDSQGEIIKALAQDLLQFKCCEYL